ncbi:hypothetical protein Rruber_01404 [Rhodococcus ruber]|uniref:hypothetical protein n=1 Tax=Rhodococcus ruber TaxID=1830 RepID=UPI00315D622C
MEYLRGNATASATGLFVICRHLSAVGEPQTDKDLQRALQPLRSQSADGDASSVLSSSLKVGEGVGIIQWESDSGNWSASPDIGQNLRDREESWPWFRGELLHRINRHAVQELTDGGKAPDLAVGLTWLMQLNPLEPMPSAWRSGPEDHFNALGWSAIQRSEQWLPFRRWAVALGLARVSDVGKAKVVIPDATTAITDQLSHLPSAGNAKEWLNVLQIRLPIFGASKLLGQLPRGGTAWSQLPAAVSLGLLKLESAGILNLQPSDDAADIVTIGLDAVGRQVGRITVEKR